MTSSDRIERWLITVGMLGILAFLTVGPIFHEHGREATEPTTITLNKQEAEQTAVAFVNDRFHLDAKPLLVTLHSHQQLQGYLQRNNTSATYSEAFRRLVPLDFYRVRLTGSELERFEIDVHPQSGEIIAWLATVSAAMTLQDSEPAMDIIAHTLSAQGFDPAGWQRADPAAATPFPIALVHPKWEAGDARLQLLIRIDHDVVTGFRPAFHIPFADARWMAKQEQSALAMSQLHLWFNLLLLAAAVVISVRYRRVLDFKQGTVMAALFLMIYTIHQFNLYPAYRTVFPEYGIDVVWANIIISLLLAALMAMFMWLAVVVGNKMIANVSPASVHHLRPEAGTIMPAMGRGYLLAFAILGLQQWMYALAQHYLGVWTINDPMLSMHNLLWPLLYPLLAWAAAISEEAIYRLYAIPLLKKIVRSTFVAALLSSMIWAIGHTTYPIYPAATRFVEVTLLGLLFAFILLKFGFLTSVFTHASVNSILMGLSLFADAGTIGPSPSVTVLWGLVCTASPALVAFILYRFRRTPFSLRHSDE